MSVHISAAVWANRSLKGNQKLVLLKFADSCDDHGENAWPSVARVSAECGLGETTVHRVIAWLTEHGFLEVQSLEYEAHRTRTYRVIPDPEVKRIREAEGCQNDTHAKSAPVPDRHPKGVSAAPDPSVNRPSVSRYNPPTPLNDEQNQRLGRFHERMRTRVFAGSNAPDGGWCEDLIRRGATDSDIEEAVEQTATRKIRGRGAFGYARAVLERRVEEREAGNDPDVEERGRREGGADRDGHGSQTQRGGLRVVGARRTGAHRVAGFDSSGLTAIGDDDEAWYREHPEDRPATS